MLLTRDEVKQSNNVNNRSKLIFNVTFNKLHYPDYLLSRLCVNPYESKHTSCDVTDGRVRSEVEIFTEVAFYE